MLRWLLALITFLVVGLYATDAFAQGKKPWAPPKVGVWTIAATDEENTVWSGDMVLTRHGTRGGKVRYRGYFDWESTDGKASGRENFTGWFDRKTGTFRMNAYEVKSDVGTLAIGRYWSRVQSKGSELVEGTWDGKGVVPGKWTAKWSVKN